MIVDFNPVAIDLGFVTIHWYGIAWALSFLMVNAGMQYTAKKYHGEKIANQLSNIIFWGFVGVFIGGRLGYVMFYSFDSFLAKPISLFYLQQGGMSFHGGVLGGILTAFWQSRKQNFSIWLALDIGALWIPLALFTVRIANFINGELWGREVEESFIFAMYFVSDPNFLPRHPSQLYEAALEGPILGLLAWQYFRIFRIKMNIAGVTTCLVIASYGVLAHHR